MIINVTQEDIDNSKDPIAQAVKREHKKDVFTDNRYIVFSTNIAHPFRLPLSAEKFNKAHYQGLTVKPFSFEI